ncbi:unnamed protein product [Pseudo-nitzschia multistriata]|uniref:Uncharacterized protein n=1 Tax=Pseudo-nitzschia multistriata TaxID=183589 RepID=A0A448Z149_9STRA|nr:unnamed protein product [Pseudo-nitzschia multistriata]
MKLSMLRSWISSRLIDWSGCNANFVGVQSILALLFLHNIVKRCLVHMKTNTMMENINRTNNEMVLPKMEDRNPTSSSAFFFCKREAAPEVGIGFADITVCWE